MQRTGGIRAGGEEGLQERGLEHVGEGGSPELKRCQGWVRSWDPPLGDKEHSGITGAGLAALQAVSERRWWLSTKELHPQTLLPHREEEEEDLPG